MPKSQPYLAAEKKIEEALQSGATELDLSNEYNAPDEKKLTELPESIGKLTQLKSLKISYHKLTTLPDSLGQLTQLTSLNLSSNQLTTLPESLGQLTQLTELNLSNNQLMTLPDSLGQLIQLQQLHIYGNQLTLLPESIGNLPNLAVLWIGLFDSGNPLSQFPQPLQRLKRLRILALSSCDIASIPNWIGELSKLSHFEFTSNKITDIPLSLTQLKYLNIIRLNDNPLNPALQSAYDACEHGKYEPLFAYLRSLEQNAEPLYEAKLVLVGEGGVGKTTLLNALMKRGDRTPKQDEATTHGVKIDVNALQVPHPEKEDVKIQLNAWDFGGQEIYRVTHQFFFSRRSLYLLVWEPRRGVQQCQVEDWLNMIRLRVGDDARVIIVSTNSKSGGHIARIDQPVFKQQYGEMIVGFHEVDSLVPNEKTGEMVGIAELKKIIAEESTKFNHVGMLFNNDWKAARDELIARPEPHISYSKFTETCAHHKLSEIDTITLAAIMNDLGHIVHYSDDEKLRNDVVLKPEWLTKAIGFVLEDRATQDAEGILPDARLTQVWRDHSFKDEPRYDPVLYPFFLRLMEKYDVSYRLPEGDASLVAQHVPQVRPELPWLPEQETRDKMRRIAMVCSMEEDPPGLIPWMIIRTHNYSVEQGSHHLHWQKGMFLNYPPHGEAMLEQRGREFHIYAQAAWPEHFMNVIRSTLEKLINDNWPGMKDRYRFMVPCPEIIDGQPCKGRFNITALRQFLVEGDLTVRCQECSKRQFIAELLYGFEDYDVREQLTEIKRTVERGFADVGDEFEKLRSQIANNFLNTMKAMASEAKNGPRLFTIEPVDGRWQWINKKYKLHLWCEAEDCQHPVYYGLGTYEFKMTQEWIAQIAPYANFIVGVMKTLLPMVAPSVNVLFGANTFDHWRYKDHLNLIQTSLSSVLPEGIKVHDPGRLKDDVLTEPERSGLLALHSFLRDVDPNQERIGLYRIPTYTGDFTWVCKKHYDLMQSKIPDVIELSSSQYEKKTSRYDAVLIHGKADLDITKNLSQLLKERQLSVSQKDIDELMKLKNNEIRAFIKSGRSFAFVISDEMLAHSPKVKSGGVVSQLRGSDIPIIAIYRSLESRERGAREFLGETKNIDLSFGYRSEQFNEWEYWITGIRPPKTKGMTWIDWLFGEGFEEDIPYLKPKERELSLIPTRIRLRNIRSFVDTGVVNLNNTKESKRHTLLLGDNSAGKSTILQCLALASLGSEKANAFGAIGTSPASYLRHATKTGYIEVEFQIDNISVESQPIEDTFVVGLKIEKGENRFETMRTDLTLSSWNANDQLNILRARNGDQFGFMCGYGPWRTLASDPKSLWSEAQIPVVDRISSLFDSNYILGHPDVVAKMLVGDFSNFRNAPKENKDKVFLHKIDELICKLLPNTNRNETGDEFSLEMNHVPISIQSMSDGYRSIMSIVGHLLYHSLSRKQWEGDPSDISGTIIIDEIDLHLHPAWQRFVFSSIQDAFPNLHIIASSHSPLVASSVDSESIIVLDKDDDQINIITDPVSVKGWRSDQILASELFGYVIDSDPEIEAVLKQASILAGKKDHRTKEEEILYEDVKNKLKDILIPSGQTLIERDIQSDKYVMISKQIKELEQKLFGDNT